MGNISRVIAAIVFLSIVSLFVGCGGGTVGTDDGAPLRVSGTVLDSSGIAIPDALVIVEATGDSARSDAEGRFKIATQEVTESRLRVDAQIAGTEISLISEPLRFGQSDGEHSITVTVSVEEGLVTVEDLDVQPVAPTATPKVTEDKTPPDVPASTSLLTGLVRDQHGNLLRGVRITIEGDRSSAVSARNGSFEVAFNAERTRIGILLEYQKRRARISITELPGAPSVMRMKVTMVVLDGQQVVTQSDDPIDIQYDYRVSSR